MVICTYFQQGRCKYGNRCRFEHPGQQQQTFQSGNRFGALSGGGGGFSTPCCGRASSGQSQQPQQSQQSQNGYGVNANDIKTDLTPGKGRPEWIFSCYGPGRNAPRQLFGGPQRELSFEELRLRHYEAAAFGNPGPAIQEAETLYREAVNQMEVVLKNLDAAVRYINDGANEHPNRIDITNGSTGTSTGQGPPAFGQQTPTFSAPGFPQQAPREPSFGQSSFIQPSPGQTSGFGQPSALGAASGFGKPSFGQSSFGQPSFGQPSFGQPSSLGASPFGQASGTATPFSQISSQTQAPSSGFGQPSPFSQAGSGFGQPTMTPATTSGFGTPSVTGNPFGRAPAFGSSPPFPPGVKPPTLPPFPGLSTGNVSQPAPTTSSAPAGTGPGAILKIENSSDLNPIPALSGETVRDPLSKKLLRWKGQPVKYIDGAPCYLHPQDQKTAVRIFFPDGPPDEASLRDAHANPEDYTSEVTEQYEFFAKNGYFKDGVIPSVPPETKWVSFDF
ncbi:FG-nucleoporin nup42 [Aspergillus lucknowensis]|uniref:C3H1-type domain-containing protein n=1 Tax=Aspergillus lucknowensis TaxID=176173 RepID=A0ABR4LVP6_9EURO